MDRIFPVCYYTNNVIDLLISPERLEGFIAENDHGLYCFSMLITSCLWARKFFDLGHDFDFIEGLE